MKLSEIKKRQEAAKAADVAGVKKTKTVTIVKTGHTETKAVFNGKENEKTTPSSLEKDIITITAKTPAKEKEKPQKKGIFGEIFRFVVVGIIATVIDLAVELLAVYGLGFTSLSTIPDYGSYIVWAIAVAAGFLVSNLANFFLSFIWVFQNVDRKKTRRSFGSLCLFTLLSAIGLFLGIGMQLLGNYVSLSCFGIDLGNLTEGAISILTSGEYLTVLAFLIVFVLKTALTMIYNYISRKLIIFKKPKSE